MQGQQPSHRVVLPGLAKCTRCPVQLRTQWVKASTHQDEATESFCPKDS